MIALSIAAAAAGLLASGLILRRLGRRPDPSPTAAWLLGLGGLGPAWLVAFLGLLGPAPVTPPESLAGASFVLSSAAALVGVISSDALLRRRQRTGRPVLLTAWLLGLAGLLPGWLIALVALAAGG